MRDVVKKEIICRDCGHDSVRREAWLFWSHKEQEWLVDDIFDTYYCVNCESASIPLEAKS